MMTIDYKEYHFEKKEILVHYIVGAIVIGMAAYLFYESYAVSFLASPLSIFYVKQKKVRKIEERKWKLNQEFKDGIWSILVALDTGYSVEKAFIQAVEDLKTLYTEETFIIQEFNYIIHLVYINVPIEEAIEDFAERSGIEDIKSFSQVFSIAKRSGGDIIKIIRSTGNCISHKVDVKREIRILVAAKKFEMRIMNGFPFIILLYLRLFSPEFVQPLYGNILGGLFMTGFLLVYFMAYKLSERIMDIPI